LIRAVNSVRAECLAPTNPRDSPHKGEADLAKALAWARASLADDPGSFRAEFVTLVERARTLTRPRKVN
jgi:hypothetical protein